MATKPRTPRRAPPRAPRRKDTRPTLVLKSVEIDDDFRRLLNAAVAESGMTQVAFAVHAIRSAAQRTLKGEVETGAGLPAVISDELTAALASLRADVTGLLAEQQRRELERQRTLWQRLRAALGGR